MLACEVVVEEVSGGDSVRVAAGSRANVFLHRLFSKN